MTTLNIDFETRSTVDLKQTGVYPYAEHPTTDLWCMGWAVDDGDVGLWVPGDDPPPLLWEALNTPEVELRAWNAQFERVIWQGIMVPRYGFNPIPLTRWHCTAAEAAAMNLPRALGHCAEVLKIEQQKTKMAAYVRRMARPRSTKGGETIWWTDPKRLQKLYDYCEQDVRVERRIGKAVRRLGPGEREVYLLDQRINDRGVPLDLKLVRSMQYISTRALEDTGVRLSEVTGGVVESVTAIATMKDWITAQGTPIESIRKAVVRDLLAGDTVPDHVRMVLTLREEAGKSSVAKLKTALKVAASDTRAHGLMLYHGAGTGRWTAKLLQPHNFPQGEVDAAPYLDMVMAREYDLLDTITAPLTVVSSMLRGMIRAEPGKRLLVGDYSQIEVRVLAWLADAQPLVAAFARSELIYEPMAARIFDVPVETIANPSFERNRGKDTILGCGFGMGHKTFRAQILEKSGVDVGEELARKSVSAYRELYPEVPTYWRAVGDAALSAVQTPGKTFTVRGSKLSARGQYLWLMLPSGRPLAYASPTIEMRRVPWCGQGCTEEQCNPTSHDVRPSVMAWFVDGKTRRWVKRALYGGMLVENIVQATARDLMVAAMLRMDAQYPTILSVHDEIVCEQALGVGTLDEFTTLAKQTPVWATGCPVDFKAWEGNRYDKK